MVKRNRVIALGILFSLVFCTYSPSIVSACSDNMCEDTVKKIAPYFSNCNDKPISRRQCISSIMKLIGVDEESAMQYAGADYDESVFEDVSGLNNSDGYIMIAGLNNVAKGVGGSRKKIFEPNRAVTTKETLTFMLRCLTNSELVQWDHVMEDSVKMGLLKENELVSWSAEQPIQAEQFYVLLCRMLNKTRYLYWSTEIGVRGYIAEDMAIDDTNSIKYSDSLQLYATGDVRLSNNP